MQEASLKELERAKKERAREKRYRRAKRRAKKSKKGRRNDHKEKPALIMGLGPGTDNVFPPGAKR